ncbi:hypothetical protein HRI_003166500 [Hibiscus trionum]|uniref:Myb-related protein 123 n=1 Tax=Hibiscus trionum TaxID=183268 RepID=A0A9W7IGZ0_HIBTR|nr:hypothetical protein HRI_003166500 [Hibiscus trionum]
MGRSPCCSKEGLNKGAWTALEDKLLVSYIKAHGEGKWRNLPNRAGLKRCGKSCRLRWLNYLRPDIKRGNISHDEEQLIIRLHNLLGNRWSLIAGRLPGRTDNEIKNYWNTTLGKKAKAKASINEPPPRKSTQTECRGATEPSSSSQATKDKIEVIRTRATRCSSQVMVPLQSPASQDIDVTNLTLLQDPFEHRDGQLCLTNDQEMVEAHSGTQVLDSLYIEINELLKGNDGEFEQLFDEAMLNDWTANPGLSDNCATDFDPLAFFLDGDDWP